MERPKAKQGVPDRAIIEAALRTWETSPIDFADAFILETACAAGETPLATFDAELERCAGALRLR